MTEPDLHKLALEFCRKNSVPDVASIEAAISLGYVVATEKAIGLVKNTREELVRTWERNNSGTGILPVSTENKTGRMPVPLK